MAHAEAVLLKSTLEINGRHFTVKLTNQDLYWEVFSSDRATSGPYAEPLVRDENQSIALKDIIAVKPVKESLQKQHFQSKSLELQALNPTAFTIWVVRKLPGYRWKKQSYTFASPDTHVILQWVEKIREILQKPEFRRPSMLLIFVNPVSGSKAGVKTFYHKVAPLLDLAGIDYNVNITQRINHARDMLMECDLKKVDGVVSVGGDGMFTEILHGLMHRTNKEQNVQLDGPNSRPGAPAVRLGIIPAGSTDTVVWSLQGCADPVTATLHIIVGDEMRMDVGAVFQADRFITYNVSLLGYGYYGDCIVESEQHRWLGPKRYDIAGAKMVLQNNVYDGEISYKPSTDTENHPRDGNVCRVGCAVCNCPPESRPDEAGDIDITVQGSPQAKNPNNDGWKTITGSFIAINNFLISCRCRFSEPGPAPTCHLGDGNADLVLVRACSRTDYFKHLYRCMKPHKDQFDFPFVEVVRTPEFKFKPSEGNLDDSTESLKGQGQRLRSRGSRVSVWNCDGEILQEPTVHFKVHRQLLPMFARGPEEPIYETTGCCSCTNRN